MSALKTGRLRSVYPCRSVTRAMAKDSDAELQAVSSNERGALCDGVRLRRSMLVCTSSSHLLPIFYVLRQRFFDVLELSSQLIGAGNGQGVYLTRSLSHRGTQRRRLPLMGSSPFCLLTLLPLPLITGFRYDCSHLLEAEVSWNC